MVITASFGVALNGMETRATTRALGATAMSDTFGDGILIPENLGFLSPQNLVSGQKPELLSFEMKTHLSAKFDSALAFASALHREQVRKGTGIPYVAHLLAVAGIALEHGANEDEAIAALLHDTIEDQADGNAPRLRERILAGFGENVLAIVEGCTDADVSPKPPWRERKEAYVAHLEDAPRSVLLVSASDKLHNARAIVADLRTHGSQLWTRFNAGPADLLWYYSSLAAAFKRRMPSVLSDQLEASVAEMHQMVYADSGDARNPSETSTESR